jgi:hypothetical protein
VEAAAWRALPLLLAPSAMGRGGRHCAGVREEGARRTRETRQAVQPLEELQWHLVQHFGDADADPAAAGDGLT